MEIIIIAASAVGFAVYIFFYRYFGVDAKIRMFVIHLFVLAFIAGLAVLLIISIVGDHGQIAVTSAIAALAAFGVLVCKYLFADFLVKKE